MTLNYAFFAVGAKIMLKPKAPKLLPKAFEHDNLPFPSSIKDVFGDDTLFYPAILITRHESNQTAGINSNDPTFAHEWMGHFLTFDLLHDALNAKKALSVRYSNQTPNAAIPDFSGLFSCTIPGVLEHYTKNPCDLSPIVIVNLDE
jgi:hypothetical protein